MSTEDPLVGRSVLLPVSMDARVKRAAAVIGVSRSAWVRMAIAEALKRFEADLDAGEYE